MVSDVITMINPFIQLASCVGHRRLSLKIPIDGTTLKNLLVSGTVNCYANGNLIPLQKKMLVADISFFNGEILIQHPTVKCQHPTVNSRLPHVNSFSTSTLSIGERDKPLMRLMLR